MIELRESHFSSFFFFPTSMKCKFSGVCVRTFRFPFMRLQKINRIKCNKTYNKATDRITGHRKKPSVYLSSAFKHFNEKYENYRRPDFRFYF